MSELAKFTPSQHHLNELENVYSSDALTYEPAERHDHQAMTAETNETPEVRPAPGEWESQYILAVTTRLEYFRLLKLVEAGDPDALKKHNAMLGQSDVELAA